MQPYRDDRGNSGIASYEAGGDFIRVRFHDGGTYVYTADSAGAEALARMKALAAAGSGLNTFINTDVRDRYAWQEPGFTTHADAGVTYEVTATVREELRDGYIAFMRGQHIPDLLATGAFAAASIAESAPGRFRMRYEANSRASLERYLREHAPRLRADFLGRFPDGVEVAREEWTVLERWSR